MLESLPEFGTGVLYAVLVSAAYTCAVALVAGKSRRPRLLEAARLGAYGTVSLVALATLVLAYAFVTHDFRIRYVARYSDRSMPLPYLFASLWGGQDGSLLWWSFLLSVYTVACIAWMKGRYRELQPYVIATLMSILGFFGVLMLFAANPFWTSLAGARPDGEGLNPLLQNFYMAIHPPSLYTGFVGCAVPFAFAVAALVTGRLDNEWIAASRKWMLFAWLFLSIGNGLGMLWAYEELGWGGYWAWDPVENAACLPWFTASAFLHSIMVQERRGMLKVWNVALVCMTFFLTIFGTFLTRSGMIASVHSFAQSDIGKYFVVYMGLILATSAGLIIWRLPLLRAEGCIETVISREALFVFNNWALLGIATFIAVATVFPKLSELWSEPVTVGPAFYNRWVVPAGLAVFALMGAGPLFGYRKTSRDALIRAFKIPLLVTAVVSVAHLILGGALGFPALVPSPAIYPGFLGVILQVLGSGLPLMSIALCAFNFAVIAQEFVRGVQARRSSRPEESILGALFRLVSKGRRRYGGYVVHAGIALMFVGFTGKVWSVDKETALRPGETFVVDSYRFTYQGSRMEVDPSKRMVFADLKVDRVSGGSLGIASPAKFIYRKMPEQPTSEVAMIHTFRDDIYLVLGSANPQTKVATFQIHINPLVSYIWLGLIVVIFGSAICLWPDLALGESGAWAYVRAAGSFTTSLFLALLLASTPARAFAQGSSSLHAGTVEMRSPQEREVFPMLLCQCGACARLPLDNCVCSTAEEERTHIRAMMASGATNQQIFDDYVARYGTAALAVPPNKGKLSAIWVVPVLGVVMAGIGVAMLLRRWKKAGAAEVSAAAGVDSPDDYDRKLDEELERLDG
ncbi:MAG: cytochrome c-type biogenesis CcmF C-terminal domain-containing protein [Myxococcales bacterium]|nr:cytochrome c-type biogenesis CcmF C-terminal domain-containing protein [Myxococcales bacterium]